MICPSFSRGNFLPPDLSRFVCNTIHLYFYMSRRKENNVYIHIRISPTFTLCLGSARYWPPDSNIMPRFNPRYGRVAIILHMYLASVTGIACRFQRPICITLGSRQRGQRLIIECMMPWSSFSLGARPPCAGISRVSDLQR